MGRLWRESGRRAVWGRPGRPDVRSVPLARCPKACKQRPDKPVAILLDTKAGTLSTENVTLLIDNPGQLEYNTQEAEQKSEKKSNVNPWTAFCWRQMQIHTVSTCLYWDRAQGPEIRTGFFKDSGICIFFKCVLRNVENSGVVIDRGDCGRKSLQVAKSTWKKGRSWSLWLTTLSRRVSCAQFQPAVER